MTISGFIVEGLPHYCHVKKPGTVESDYNNANLYFEMTFSLPLPFPSLKVPHDNGRRQRHLAYNVVMAKVFKLNMPG